MLKLPNNGDYNVSNKLFETTTCNNDNDTATYVPFPPSDVGLAMGGLLIKVGGADKIAPWGGGGTIPGGGRGGGGIPGLGGSDMGGCIRGLGPLARACAIMLGGGNPGGGPGGTMPGIPGGGPGGLPGGGPGGNIRGGGLIAKLGWIGKDPGC